MHSKHKGTLAETKITADLYQRGYSVAIPVDDLMPFDLICIDSNFNMYKIQVKYCKINDGGIDLPIRTSMSNKTLCYKRRYTTNEVDVFAVYVPDTDECLYIKSDILNRVKCSFRIRFVKPKINIKTVNMKDNYLDFPY